jgi:hypothetical protein
VALAVRPEHLNPNGVLHGGLPYILVDYAMGAERLVALAIGTFFIHAGETAGATEADSSSAAR